MPLPKKDHDHPRQESRCWRSIGTRYSDYHPAEKLKVSIHQLDAERTELVKSTIENMKPGKPLDHAAIREINKIETKKNRLIVARLASLLKKGDPAIQAVVHQIIEL